MDSAAARARILGATGLGAVVGFLIAALFLAFESLLGGDPSFDFGALIVGFWVIIGFVLGCVWTGSDRVPSPDGSFNAQENGSVAAPRPRLEASAAVWPVPLLLGGLVTGAYLLPAMLSSFAIAPSPIWPFVGMIFVWGVRAHFTRPMPYLWLLAAATVGAVTEVIVILQTTDSFWALASSAKVWRLSYAAGNAFAASLVAVAIPRIRVGPHRAVGPDAS